MRIDLAASSNELGHSKLFDDIRHCVGWAGLFTIERILSVGLIVRDNNIRKFNMNII